MRSKVLQIPGLDSAYWCMDRRTEEEALYAARVSASNLRYLRATYRGPVHDDALRRSSNVIRDLLVHDEFGRAWRTLGFSGEPRVSAVDLERALTPYDLSRIRFAQAGGAEFEGVQVAALSFSRVDGLEMPTQRLDDPPFTEFGLRRFLDSPCLLVTKVETVCGTEDCLESLVRTPRLVTRRAVIKYLANRLGGSHLSRGKTESEKELFALLDSAPTAIVLGKRAIFWEALSIGQAIGLSSDAERLIAAVESRTGPITEPVESRRPDLLERLGQLRCPEGTAHESRVIQDFDRYVLICATCPSEWSITPRRRTTAPVAVIPIRVVQPARQLPPQ